MVTPQERFQASLNRATAGISYSPAQLRSLGDIAKFTRASPAARKKMTNPFVKDANGKDANDFSNFSTSVFNLPKTPEYSRVAKPLTADVLQAFGLRRSAVDEAYKTALAQEESGIGRFRASFEAARQRLDRDASTASSRIAQQLAGRGLARSPMIRGRQERELGQAIDDQLGEMKLNLSTEIEGLQQASENARLQRLNLMAQIEQEEALARSQSVDYIEVN